MSTVNMLEDVTRRYSPLCVFFKDPAVGLSLCLRLFSGKKSPIILFWPILRHFWGSVVPLVTFSNNLNNFERNLRKFIFFFFNPKKSQQISKIQKKLFKKKFVKML